MGDWCPKRALPIRSLYVHMNPLMIIGEIREHGNHVL